MIETKTVFRLFCLIVTTFMVLAETNADTLDAGRASNFIEKLGNDAVSMVSNTDLNNQEKTSRFRALLKKNFALKPIARFVLGRYWRKANSRQRERYVALFEDYIVRSYSSRFSEYKGETFRIIDEQSQKESGAVVKTMILRPEGEAVEVRWFLREHDGQLKILDVVIEGISMSLTQRSDFAAAVRKNGGNIDLFLDSFEKIVNAN